MTVRSVFGLATAVALAAAAFTTPTYAAPQMVPVETAGGVTLVWGGRHHHHHGFGYYGYRPYYRSYAYIAPPVYVAPRGCGWLKAKAIDTGSRYWWRRYRACLDD